MDLSNLCCRYQLYSLCSGLQRNSTIALDISCVKETPLKKQVANPLKLKLQRARYTHTLTMQREGVKKETPRSCVTYNPVHVIPVWSA